MTKLIQLLSLLLGLISATASAETPENRLHHLYPFVGSKLPDTRSNDGAKLKVALYNDAGVWSTGFEHLKLFFASRGYAWLSINANQIKAGILVKEAPDVLVMPGGASWEYLSSLGEDGANKIRNYVNSGGAYVGICAGAFYAVSHREGGYATGKYGIGLLEGTAYDGTALGTEPFIEGMMGFDVAVPGIPAELQMVLLGGPSFRYSESEARARNLEIVAKFPGTDDPAAIWFHYGKGRVFLAGPHLEIEENIVQWEYRDPETDWPLLRIAFLSASTHQP
jgi:glutamine amidotransferase-like uncharacterized protein